MMDSLHSRRLSPRRQQRGVALFIALIVMVALSLAGVALIRSVDTTTSVVGNIAFRQASLMAANWAIEQASASLYTSDAANGTPAIGDTTTDNPAQKYFAVPNRRRSRLRPGLRRPPWWRFESPTWRGGHPAGSASARWCRQNPAP
jgi:Tfp pilus assembly protein PilX